MNIIELKNISRSYSNGNQEFKALDNIDLSLEAGKFIVILGPSGAGKSTLLNLLGGLDYPTSGKIIVDGQDITKLSQNQMADYRASKVGFIFQFYNLIPALTVHENVKLVHENVKNGIPASQVLKDVGLENHLKKFPYELSGGEQQRVSIARAIAKNPQILLCDEPTGALDSKTGGLILELLYKMSKDYGKTIIIVTHNQKIADVADVVIHVKNGQINSYTQLDNPQNIADIEW